MLIEFVIKGLFYCIGASLSLLLWLVSTLASYLPGLVLCLLKWTPSALFFVLQLIFKTLFHLPCLGRWVLSNTACCLWHIMLHLPGLMWVALSRTVYSLWDIVLCAVGASVDGLTIHTGFVI